MSDKTPAQETSQVETKSSTRLHQRNEELEVLALAQPLAVTEVLTAMNEEIVPPQSTDFFQAVLDALTAHIAVLDENGIILTVNRAWRRFAQENDMDTQTYGVGENYLATCSSVDGPDSETAQAVVEGLRLVLTNSLEEFYLEYPCHSPTQKRWFTLCVTHFYQEGRLRVVVAHENITSLKMAEEVLIQQTEELTRSNADLERFAYVASHDLQEPLRMVVSFVQLLAKRYKGRLDQDADDFIGFAVDGAYRMQQLINDLLAYSRLGTRGEEYKKVNCNMIVRDAIEDVKQVLEESGGRFTSDPLPVVKGDPTQIRQLFQNLISNALKFHGAVPPQVHVSAQKEAGFWHLYVRDNGIGIAAQHFERIFVVFQRLHTQSEYPGTGIGLALCKKIVQRHGGKIWVESCVGSGSTFHFTLPTIEEEA